MNKRLEELPDWRVGATRADEVFEAFVKAEIAAKRRQGFEPAATNDLMAFLSCWAAAFPGLTSAAMRAGFLEYVERTLDQLMDEVGKKAVTENNSFLAAKGSIFSAVRHFVGGEPAPYRDFAADTREVFAMLRETDMAANGWRPAPDGVGFVRVRRMGRT